MTVRVGIIGTGLIGTDHGQKLARQIAGATVAGVTDVNRARAERLTPNRAPRVTSCHNATSACSGAMLVG